MAVDHGLHYSVEVKSRFALFLDEDSDLPDTQHETLPVRAKPEDNQTSLDNSRKPRNPRGAPANSQTQNRGVARGNSAKAPAGEISADHLKEENRPQRQRPHPVPQRGREFDRKSGSDKTGVKAVSKKDGYGTGNWGTVDDEIEATMTDNNQVLDTSNENIENESQEPPAPPTLTLEEYKAMQKGCIASKDAGRTANDGKDVFKDMKLVKSNKPKVEVDEPKFASVYYSVNDSGIALTVSRKGNAAPRSDRPTTRGRGAGGPRGERGRGGRGGFGGDRQPREEGGRGGFGGERAPREEGERPARTENEDAPRGNRPPRGRGGAPGNRGAPRGAPRGGRGAAAPTGGESRPAKVQVFNDNDFPALG